ncbi:MAG: DUF4142 domain-containing protein [Phenylobacterium sp.]|uniref:DUF4142 domain-containing protein n=1 Tax=Phenylobacterium sp. TaxID=1871053 RepID=UPI002732242E|nr:DUF4142 domain-containing protein [Phenylobacterium sp.]MDP2009844.1 DUF4142 domain-containing protein [Phenylobacterium sp.]MDP3870306.1 DUF4142 domain-containing protein [Phenylobacterium sp.]HQT52447.1 DUF4142 domain-containing protein [Phenylobacterium sp.]
MSRHLLIAGACIAALSLAACGQKADPAATDTVAADQAAMPAADVAPAAPAAVTMATDFVPMAAASDMFEIEAAKVAQTKSTNAEVKKFAAEMIAAHTKSSADLKKAIADSGQTMTPPAALPADKQAMLDSLKAADAAGFDKMYVDGQVVAHQEALNLMQGYADGGDVPALKAFATATAPVVKGHHDMAKMMADKMM